MRVILATRRAGAIALRNPDALVVDYEQQCVRRGDDRVSFSFREGRTQMFRFCASLCCAIGGAIDRRELIDLLWADDPDGGPLFADSIISKMLRHARPFLRWAGISVRSAWSRTMVVGVVAEAGEPSESFRLGRRGAPRRIAA